MDFDQDATKIRTESILDNSRTEKNDLSLGERSDSGIGNNRVMR